VVFRKGFGTIYDQNDLALWRANFGRNASGGAIGESAVPEPAPLSITLGLLAIVSALPGHARDFKKHRRDAPIPVDQ
jgi:hypothetical protein